MVVAPKLGGGVYCIDQVEVSYYQYKLFWDANPNPANQPPFCSWNTTYTPSSAWPPANIAKPVAYVDWCDAYAYCAYMGRRLCGKVSGGSNAPADYTAADKSMWFNACTAQGVNDYPYGDIYSADACIDNVATTTSVWDTLLNKPLGLATCQGGSPGLYHMSGNLAEWEDSCSGSSGTADSCRVRGGSYDSSLDSEVRCDADASLARDYTGPEVGLRCCL